MRKRVFSLLVAGAVFAPLAAQAQAPAVERRDCLRLGLIDGFSPIAGTDRAFVVTDRMHRRFKINLMHRCGGLDFNMAVGFKTLERGQLACISRGDTVISHDPGIAGDRCPISSVVPYTPAMEAADRAEARDQARRR